MSVSTHSERTYSRESVGRGVLRRPTGSRGFSMCTDPKVPEWRTDAWTDPKVPEWRTDAWKRQVEAEARRNLKDKIHDVGAGR